MRIISFAETTPALLAGRKTVTRREWKESYAYALNPGDLLQAWDKNPRTGKGKRVGTIRLTAAPRLEAARDVPDEDWEGEGFAYLAEHGLTLFGGATPREVFDGWRRSTNSLWVVRFELVELLTERDEAAR
ncbi:MAG: hypothetical protein WC273_00375 [Dehalococcoidia bacterium]